MFKQTIDVEYSKQSGNQSNLIDESNLKTIKLLDVNYEQILNDNANSCQSSDKNKLRRFNSIPKQKRRRNLRPLKISEEPDDETRSLISDSTLIPIDEFQSSKYINSATSVSQYFPGYDLFSFLSSRQFVQANDELERENAHFKISEAIIGTIEQVNIILLM